MHVQNFKGHIKSRYVDVDKIIGGNLRQIRTDAHISQMELAGHLGITFQQIQKYEKGTNRISCSVLYTMSNFFDIPILSFFAGLHFSKRPVVKTPANNKDADFLHDFNKLPFELQQNIRKMVKRMTRDD